MTSSVVTQRFIGECVELACIHISLELAIPTLSIKCGIPSTKCSKFIRRKFLDLLFNRFNFARTKTSLPETAWNSTW